jgi:hypothetical protein
MSGCTQKRIVAGLMGGLLLVTGAASAARADVLVQNTGVLPTTTDEFAYDYQITVSTTQEVTPEFPTDTLTSSSIHLSDGAAADFFTIYDFVGYTGIHSEPAGWVLHTQLVGQTPSGPGFVPPPDNATILNLTWVYTNGPTIFGPNTVSTFVADSIFGLHHLGFWAAQGTVKTDFSKFPEKGTTEVPLFTSPEPTSLLLGALGCLIAPALLRRRPVRRV